MSHEQLSVFILCTTFGAFTFHVALDNAIAAVRWVLAHEK